MFQKVETQDEPVESRPNSGQTQLFTGATTWGSGQGRVVRWGVKGLGMPRPIKHCNGQNTDTARCVAFSALSTVSIFHCFVVELVSLGRFRTPADAVEANTFAGLIIRNRTLRSRGQLGVAEPCFYFL